jgi:hypothetical protein
MDTDGTSSHGLLGPARLALPLFILSFVVVGQAYRTLPDQVPVLRTFIGHTALVASKSAFVAFRVPMMNLIHGAMAALMLARAPAFATPQRRAGYYRMFGTLLFMVAIKSLLEALDLSSSALARAPAPAHLLGAGTLLCVIGGAAVALWHGRKVTLPWPESDCPAQQR